MAPRKIALLLALVLSCGIAWGQEPNLKLERTIPLPGVVGRIDHLTADLDSGRVLISALGNGSIEVVDLKRGQRVNEIRGLKEPQDILYLPQQRAFYVATGGDGMVRRYNGRTLSLTASIRLGTDADNLAYDHRTGNLVVGFGSGAIALLPLDLSSNKIEVRLPVHPERFEFTSDGSHLLVNLPDDRSVDLIDTAGLKIVAKWTHLGALGNFPMAVDPDSPRFFVACRAPAELLELNERNGSVMQRIPTVGVADDLFYDPERARIYVIGGGGYVDVVDAPKNGRLRSIEHVSTAPGARTGLFVPAWNELLVAAPHRGVEPARLLVYGLR